MFQIARFLPKSCFTNILIPYAPILCNNIPKSNIDFNIYKIIFNNNKATVVKDYEYTYYDYYFTEIIKLDTNINTVLDNNEYNINERIKIKMDTCKELKINLNYLLNINSHKKIYFDYDIKFNKNNPILIDLLNYYNTDTKKIYYHLGFGINSTHI
jgi:hypothetical protein